MVFNRGTYANTIGVNNPPPAYTTITQVDASYSRCAALAYTTVSTAKYYTDPSISWNSNYKGTWGLILDAVRKVPAEAPSALIIVFQRVLPSEIQ